MSAVLEVQVDDEFPSERISRYWEQGFFITSMATLPTQWAVVMSTDSGFEEQYVRVHHVVGTTHPSKCGTAIGRRGHFDCKEDPSGRAPHSVCLGAHILLHLCFACTADAGFGPARAACHSYSSLDYKQHAG